MLERGPVDCEFLHRLYQYMCDCWIRGSEASESESAHGVIYYYSSSDLFLL